MGNISSIFENCIEVVKISHLQAQENNHKKPNKDDIVYTQNNIFDDAEYIIHEY